MPAPREKIKHTILNSLAAAGLLTAAVTVSFGCREEAQPEADVQVSRTESPVVFVSIPPQKAFVQEIAGERPEVHVLVKPGQSPATYDPSPKQMMALSSAHLYLRIGVPFEEAWMDRLRDNNRRMLIVNTIKNIKRRSMESHTHELHGGGQGDDTHAETHDRHKDPHVWLDPQLVKSQARVTCDALKKVDPYNSHKYETNLVAFQQKLDDLDSYIRQRLSDLENRTFMVFHPSWGYFAEAYDLQQLAIEVSGKEPSGKALMKIIDHAREAKVHTIFVQPQFSRSTAETIAREIGAKVASLDPLAKDYFKNMRKVADKLAGTE